MTHVLVWDIETVPDLAGFAAANGSATNDIMDRSWTLTGIDECALALTERQLANEILTFAK
jgi:hypothetical protein